MKSVTSSTLSSALRVAALAVALMFGGGNAQAAIITYTDEATFLVALQPGYYRETFASLPEYSSLPNPSAFSGNGFSYEVSAPGGLYSGPANVPQIATVDAADSLTTTITGGNVNAIGFNTFSGDVNGRPDSGPITLAFSNGQTQAFTTTTPSSFFGVIDTNAPLASFTVTSNATTGFATITNLTVGTAKVSPVPEPSTWVMMFIGVGAMCLVVRRKRDAEV